ncbi:MAG: hypothetical protein N3A61_05620, partial [Ignavibacteria bacterium]|nr:hypothetical protein [Ignavibacteria bacterium]
MTIKTLKYLSISFLLVIYFVDFGLAQIRGDSRIIVDTFYFQNQNKFILKSKYAVDSIISLKLNAIVLKENDYSRLQNKIILSPNLKLNENNQLVVTYKILPIIINETYRKNVLSLKYDSVRTEIIQQVEKTSPVILKDIFGKQIQKSGTLIRGFQLGSNKDLTLNSGLRLQLSGKLSDELDVVAVLTDENSPIQPEGNTQTIQELDKVYIELKHKYFKTVFGDYQIENKIGEFGSVQRKLQGLKTNFSITDNSDLEFSYASSKGKFNSIQFNGIDG